MKRLLILALTVLLCFSSWVRAEGPDEKYIEIYKVIQEGNQLSTTGQADLARQRYLEAQAALKKLQASYPNWNQKLVEFRLHYLESKLAATHPASPPAQAPTTTPSPAPSAAHPQPAPTAPAPVQPVTPPVQAPAQPVQPTPAQVAPAKPQAETDVRDNQIKALQEQVGRLQNDRAVLEAKLREALAAQPAAVDPRELAKAEERIRTLEKERAVLQVSLQVAEGKAAQQKDTQSAELKKALAEAKQKLNEQNDIIVALRQEKSVLEERAQSTKRSDDEIASKLRTENDTLKKQLTERPAVVAAPARGGEEPSKELVVTKAALQTSRDTVASLQVRLRTLQEERDRLEKTRRDLETKLASAPATSSSKDSAQVRKLEKENEDLQKKLSDTTRQLADAKSKSKPTRTAQPSDDVSALRARLETLEARKVPYTQEELALFKKPIEPAALTSIPPATAPAKELPANAAPLIAEAQRALAARHFDEAEKKLSEVLRMDDKNVETLQRLAAAQLEQNRPKDAEGNLKRALEQKPSDARSLLLMGIANFDQDKFDEALDYLSRSAQADPQNPETQNYLGITLSQKGQRAAAETALRKAIQISPNYSSAHYNLAVVYATQKPPFTELARWHYQKALAYGHPQNSDFEKMIEKKQASSSQP
jgi:tetratricopeptide (TPR) repeat protein